MTDIDILHIHVESEPVVVPDDVLLNRPAPRQGAFLIHKRLDKALWTELKRAGAWYWSADDLEDMDMFFSEPGWRYPLSALEILIKRGYTLRVYDTDIADVAALRALFTDDARDAREARRVAEEAERAEAKRIAEEQRRDQRVADRAELENWRAANLAGLTYTTVYPPYNTLEFTDERLHFRAGWYTTGNSYRRIHTPHGDGWIEEYGNATVAYVPQAAADEWYAAYWQERANPGAALYHLNRHLTGTEVFGGDFTDWLIEHVGEETLAELARSAGPHTIQFGTGWAVVAASKTYRIPLQIGGNVGYGNPSQKDGPTAWLPIEQVSDDTVWPTAADFAERRQESAEMAATFSAMFTR